MATVYFASLVQGDVIEVAFLKPQGEEIVLPLLIDSGFTGQSCFVLAEDADGLAQAPAPSSSAAGALRGMQRRVMVTCRIPGLSMRLTVISILADLTSLTLPAGIQGLAGLRFLRHFRRWGAEQSAAGSWRFFLSNEST